MCSAGGCPTGDSGTKRRDFINDGRRVSANPKIPGDGEGSAGTTGLQRYRVIEAARRWVALGPNRRWERGSRRGARGNRAKELWSGGVLSGEVIRCNRRNLRGTTGQSGRRLFRCPG